VAARRRLLSDVTPLRESGQYRLLYSGELFAFLGSQLTVVAVPLQVYLLTRSSLAVGLVGLAQLGPLLACSLVGGVVVDAVDRRVLLVWVQPARGALSVGLVVNALQPEPALWPLYVLTALGAGADRGHPGHGPPRAAAGRGRAAPDPHAGRRGRGPGGGGPGRRPRGPGHRLRDRRGRLRPREPAGLRAAAAAARCGDDPRGARLGPRGVPLPARPARAPGHLPDRPERHGLRHAPGAVPGARHRAVSGVARARSGCSTRPRVRARSWGR
jgi:Transmembrane secretion effector